MDDSVVYIIWEVNYLRQRYKPWAETYIKEHSAWIIPNPEEFKGKWQTAFNNENPVHIEVGTGKGQFLIGMAKMYPEINFIGIELAQSVIVTATEKVMAADVKNLLLLNKDANDLRDFFADNEIDTVYLNFSDPWPKNRHEKRRLTYHTFLEQYRDILLNEKNFQLKTDNRSLFEYSLLSFSAFGMKLEEVSLDLHKDADPLNIMTEYEEKFSAKGHPIYRCRASFPSKSK